MRIIQLKDEMLSDIVGGDGAPYKEPTPYEEPTIAASNDHVLVVLNPGRRIVFGATVQNEHILVVRNPNGPIDGGTGGVVIGRTI